MWVASGLSAAEMVGEIGLQATLIHDRRRCPSTFPIGWHCSFGGKGRVVLLLARPVGETLSCSPALSLLRL